MSIVVTKFGGSSLCDAARFQNVASILRADSSRRYVIPSAPGKRFDDDDKVTDLLYRCHALAAGGEDFDEPFGRIAERFAGIAQALSLPDGWQAELDAVRQRIPMEETPDYTASRGEYLCGRLLAAYLGWDFIDAADVIFFDENGRLDAEKTNAVCAQTLAEHEFAVIPGFYGSMPDGRIHTFSRGGSDVSGAIVARAVLASLYENWTDVPGFLMADPRIVENPRLISSLTYRELREPFVHGRLRAARGRRVSRAQGRAFPSISAPPCIRNTPARASCRARIPWTPPLPGLQDIRGLASSPWKRR